MSLDLQELFDLTGRDAPPTRLVPGEVLHRARRTRSRRLATLAFAAVAAVAVAVGGILWSLPGWTAQPATHQRPSPTPSVTLRANGPIMAPSGCRLVAIDPRTGIDDYVDVPLQTACGAREYAWAADGRSAAGLVRSATGAEVLRVWLGGSGIGRSISSCDGCSWLAWTPSGDTVLVLRGQRLRAYDTTSGQADRAWKLPVASTNAALSPDGRRLALTTCVGVCGRGSGPRTGGLELVDLTTGQTRMLAATADLGWMLGPVSWSPDGRTLAYFSLRQVAPSELRMRLMTVVLATQRIAVIHDTGASCYCAGLSPSLAWSPDGRLLAVSMPAGRLDAGWNVAITRPDGSAWRPLPRSTAEPWLAWRAAG
ncbi:MAG TPA: hypothetical protein VMI11_10545 [Actinomycetes bacterium]|nr:hypothetical protein [Actinomycetes bacterium]